MDSQFYPVKYVLTVFKHGLFEKIDSRLLNLIVFHLLFLRISLLNFLDLEYYYFII
jgi:hypothetical protein